MSVLKKIFGSSKVWVAMISGALVGVMNYFNVDPDIQEKIIMVLATLLGSMGLADFGKYAKPK
jgi:phage shock protein PspC (stress-responsive transcriptional regulator)